MVKVNDGHKFHSNMIGYFQFMGGPEKDAVVLSTEPLTCMSFEYPRENRYSLFAVDLGDIQEFLCRQKFLTHRVTRQT